MKPCIPILIAIFGMFSIALDAQRVIPAEVPLNNYRKILMAHTEDLVRFAELEWRCLKDLEDACNCNNVFSSIVLNANRTDVIDLESIRKDFRRCFPGIRFTAGMNGTDILTIMANERLIKLRDSKILAFDNGHDFIEENWYEGVINVANLSAADKVAILQSDDHLLGEVMSAAGLDDTIVIVNNYQKMTQTLFRSAPQVAADFWKLPQYVFSENLELPEGKEPNKVVLLDVLRHYNKPTKVLRQLASRLYPDDEVIVVEAIDSITSPYVHSSFLSPEECDRLLTKRNYKLIEGQTRNGFYMARYRFVPPKNTKLHFAWKPQRTRISRTGNHR